MNEDVFNMSLRKFLKKVGVEFGMADMTVQGSTEAKEAARAKLTKIPAPA